MKKDNNKIEEDEGESNYIEDIERDFLLSMWSPSPFW